MQIGCLYIPDFPAWALARTMPSSAPMVAIWAGRVIASRGARGVEVGDRADRVARLCPEAVVRVRDIHVEQACWEGVLRSLHRVTPFIESADPPFVCFRADTGDAIDTLAAELGIQIGLAGHRATARLAAVRAASGHVLRIPDARRIAFLDRFEAEEAEKYKNKARTGFGAQIRNYFLHPDQRVKDARTGYSEGNFHYVLDGNIQDFLDAYLKWRGKEEVAG